LEEKNMTELKGNKYGTHRVIEPKGVLTQAAWKIDNDMTKRYSNEIVVDVISLNIDSASFTQISEACGHDPKKIGEMIQGIVAERGKQQNPVTGSGGMFIGTVAYIGSDLRDRDLKVGDKIASLVSLSLTPLRIDKILAIHPEIDRLDIKGQAILFETGLYAKLPDDMTEPLALAALDVAGAPAQARKLPKEGDSVLILGANGKSGVLCAWEALKKVGPKGKVVGVVRNPKQVQGLKDLGVYTDVVVADCTKPVEVLDAALAANGGKEYDISICCVNIESCEMSAILPVHDDGLVYFFSMATSFTKAALGAEGCGKDVTMIIGNGYTKNHAQITLDVLRENKKIRDLFDQKYV
jgi:L-erythro-3,5-diaminohexanoate dehydrogenase